MLPRRHACCLDATHVAEMSTDGAEVAEHTVMTARKEAARGEAASPASPTEFRYRWCAEAGGAVLPAGGTGPSGVRGDGRVPGLGRVGTRVRGERTPATSVGGEPSTATKACEQTLSPTPNPVPAPEPTQTIVKPNAKPNFNPNLP